MTEQTHMPIDAQPREPQRSRPLPVESSAVMAGAMIEMLRGRIDRSTFDRLLARVPG